MRERCPGCWGGCCSPRDRREAGVRLRAGSQNGLRSGSVKRSAVPSTCGQGSRQAAGVRVKNLGFCAFFFFFFFLLHRLSHIEPRALLLRPGSLSLPGVEAGARECRQPPAAPQCSPPPPPKGSGGLRGASPAELRGWHFMRVLCPKDDLTPRLLVCKCNLLPLLLLTIHSEIPSIPLSCFSLST